MIYDYIVSPNPRRLVFTTEGLPTVTLPLAPVVFGALLDLVEQEGEASLSRLEYMLRVGLDMLWPQGMSIDEDQLKGDAHA